jgi:flagellin
MTSVLNNSSSMVALQTLKSINSNLTKTQNDIATGTSVSSAKDNAAVWAISKVMESDIKGFKGIQESLSLGEATLTVARQAAETVTDLLIQMKGKIVAAQESNVDRDKIQVDVAALRSQIEAVVGSAQFNGLNLVDGSAGNSFSVLASLDRDSSGNVTTSSLSIDTNDLSTGSYTANDVFNNTTSAAATGSTVTSTDADTFIMTLDRAGGSDVVGISDGATAWAAGDSVSITIGDKTASYLISANDVASTNNSVSDLVAVGLKNAIDALGIADLTVDYDSTNPGDLVFTNGGTTDLSVTGQFANAGSGALGTLDTINVSTATGAATALGNIEGLIQTAIDASASFGSSQGRVSTQSDFVSGLTDAMQTGMGSLVDADLEEASARLQALQVQQQLATQALSIANQAPQNILSLFR